MISYFVNVQRVYMYRFNNLSYKLNFVNTYINLIKLLKIAFNNLTNFLFIN